MLAVRAFDARRGMGTSKRKSRAAILIDSLIHRKFHRATGAARGALRVGGVFLNEQTGHRSKSKPEVNTNPEAYPSPTSREMIRPEALTQVVPAGFGDFPSK